MPTIGYSYSTDNVELPVKDDSATTALSRGFVSVGVDAGGVARFLRTDTDGRIEVVGGGGVLGTVDQGSPAVVANAWPIKVTDGTDTAAVLPASTAPVATDPALVVTLSPNLAVGTLANPLRIDPTGTATQPVSGTVTSKLADEEGRYFTSTLKNNTRSISVESRDIVLLLAQMLDELRILRRQMAALTDEEDPL